MAIRDLLVRIRGDSSQVDRELMRTTRALEQFGANLTQLGQRLTVGITAPLVGIGAAALKLSADAEEAEAKFHAVFGSFAEGMVRFSEDLGSALGRSAIELRGLASSFQDTFVPLGFAREEATRLSETMVRATLDLAAFYDQADPEVANRLTSALVGNHSAVRSFGVVLSQATLEAELFRMGVEGGVQAATEQEKVQARLNLILQQTADAAGTAAAEADGATAGWKSFTSTLRDIAREIGDTLLPLANQLQRALTSQLRVLLELDRDTMTWVVSLGAAAAAIGPTVAALGLLTGAVAKLATALSVGLLPLIGTGGAVIIGLTALAAAFLRVKINAAAAGDATAEFAASLSGMPLAELTAMWEEITDKRIELQRDIKRFEDTLANPGLSDRQRGTLERRVETLRKQLGDLMKSAFAVHAAIQAATSAATAAPPSGGEGAPAAPAIGPIDSPERRTDFVLGFHLPALRELPVLIGRSRREIEVLVDSFRPFEQMAMHFVGVFADTLVDALREGANAFRAFADYAIQQILRVAARLVIFRFLQMAFPGSAFVENLGIQSGFLRATTTTVTASSVAAGAGGASATGAGLRLNLDLSGMPAARDPRMAARDQEWLTFLGHSLVELQP